MALYYTDGNGKRRKVNPTTKRELAQLDELLKPFRRHESKDDLAVIVDNPEAIRLLAAWGNHRFVWKPATRKVPDAGVWEWLWDKFFWGPELADRAGVSVKRAEELLRVLCGARVIYPDGTISKPAKRLISEHVKQRWPGRRRGRPAGSKDRSKRKTKGKASEK